MSDKRIVNIQLTKTKSVVAVEIGKNEYVDADGVTYKNINSDLISDANDISEEEKHAFGYMASLLGRTVYCSHRSLQRYQTNH